jgi:hypothetical protein
MAQTGYTPILIYASGTPSNIPSAGNLTSGSTGAELALNYADGKLYFKNSSGVVTLLASASAIGVSTVASGTMYLNNQTVTASYSIPSGSNAMSAGPITVATGQTVTVPTGSRWVIA